jgi:hypothetical protein
MYELGKAGSFPLQFKGLELQGHAVAERNAIGKLMQKSIGITAHGFDQRPDLKGTLALLSHGVSG